jgi:hypothetical protein
VAFVKHSGKHIDNSKSFKKAGKMQKKAVRNKEARREDEEEIMTAIDVR